MFFVLQDREANLKSRYASVKADGEKIHTLVKENLEYFKAEEESEDWKKYIEYLDDLLLDGFFECVVCSLSYLMENMDKEKSNEEARPLLEAKFELQVSSKLINNSLCCGVYL